MSVNPNQLFLNQPSAPQTRSSTSNAPPQPVPSTSEEPEVTPDEAILRHRERKEEEFREKERCGILF